MQRIEKIIIEQCCQATLQLWNVNIGEEVVQVQKTRKGFTGDFTVVVFPLLRYSKLSPEQTGELLGEYLRNSSGFIEDSNVIKGFLNLVVSQRYWKELLNKELHSGAYGILTPGKEAPMVTENVVSLVLVSV